MSIATHARRAAGSTGRWSWTSLLIAPFVFSGAATVLYPTAADWFSDRAHATELSGYVESIATMPSKERQAMLDLARAYNADLPSGPLRDPYTLKSDGSASSVEVGRAEYLNQLSVSPDSPMARVRIPELRVDLPIYHGTSEEVLRRGVGHLYGSALPVGGISTHAVITGYSGLPSSTLFTNLYKLVKGDRFHIDVAGETLTYEVDQILTVEPDSGDALRQVPGRDYLTLLTCTPIGVNSHRLLVRGERIATEESDDSQRFAANAQDPGFPWWSVPLAVAAGSSIWIAWPARGRPRRSAQG